MEVLVTVTWNVTMSAGSSMWKASPSAASPAVFTTEIVDVTSSSVTWAESVSVAVWASMSVASTVTVSVSVSALPDTP